MTSITNSVHQFTSALTVNTLKNTDLSNGEQADANSPQQYEATTEKHKRSINDRVNAANLRQRQLKLRQKEDLRSCNFLESVVHNFTAGYFFEGCSGRAAELYGKDSYTKN